MGRIVAQYIPVLLSPIKHPREPLVSHSGAFLMPSWVSGVLQNTRGWYGLQSSSYVVTCDVYIVYLYILYICLCICCPSNDGRITNQQSSREVYNLSVYIYNILYYCIFYEGWTLATETQKVSFVWMISRRKLGCWRNSRIATSSHCIHGGLQGWRLVSNTVVVSPSLGPICNCQEAATGEHCYAWFCCSKS